MNITDANLFQIFYSTGSRRLVCQEFEPLDNTGSPRPDWFEIDPIVRYFDDNPVVDNDWYGFFSPRFYEKTNISCARVVEAVSASATTADALLFSAPLRREFSNVFLQGEASHPGLLPTANDLLQRWSIDLDLRTTRFERNRTVFSNYFVARGFVWKKWLMLTESLVEIANDAKDPLYGKLNEVTTYRADLPGVQMKVFIAERLISLVFHLNPEIRVKAIRPSDPCKWLPRPLRKLVGCRRRT